MQYIVISVIFTPSVSPLSGGETSPPTSRGRNRGGIKTIIEYNTIRILILLFLTSIIQVSIAQIITVKQDSTGDYMTIQEGVDAAADGDTVLVWPGTYFENININGKVITLGSLTLTTQNPQYINQTIIDGNQSGSCINISSCEQTVEINGFTIQHGTGTYFGLEVWYYGGGLYVLESDVLIKNCIIKNNLVTGAGGGIACNNSSLYLSNISVYNNQAYNNGGGIYNMGGIIEFDSLNLCNIYLNYSNSGCDIYRASNCPQLHIVADTFTVLNPDSYFLFSDAGLGYPNNDITYNILNSKIETFNSDLYVNPSGDNDNSGLTLNDPLKNISFALSKIVSDSLHPNTIHLVNGIYSPSNGEKYPLNLRSYVSIHGQNRDSTILDAENLIYHLCGNNYTDNYSIKYLTIKNGNGNINSFWGFGSIVIVENHNVVFEDILFTENIGKVNSCGTFNKSNNGLFKNVEFYHNYGGKAFCTGTGWTPGMPLFFSDTVRVVNSIFRENMPDYDTTEAYGGGARVKGIINHPDSMTCYFANCLFIGNTTKLSSNNGSSALSVSFGAQVYLTNCTFGNNIKNSTAGQGAAIGVTYGSKLHIYNSVLYNDVPSEIYMYSDTYGDSFLNIYYSLIEGGLEGINVYSPYNHINYDPTNIDTNPLWDTAGFYPYMLTAGSPCINAGTLDLPEGVVLPETDILGNPRVWDGFVDMGAYEYGPWVGIEVPGSKFQVSGSMIISVSPNPFSYSTSISYKAPDGGHIKIEVYDMNGRKVTKLMDVKQLPGSGKFYWDGTDDYGRKLPAGNYLLKLVINNNSVDNLKLVKIK